MPATTYTDSAVDRLIVKPYNDIFTRFEIKPEAVVEILVDAVLKQGMNTQYTVTYDRFAGETVPAKLVGVPFTNKTRYGKRTAYGSRKDLSTFSPLTDSAPTLPTTALAAFTTILAKAGVKDYLGVSSDKPLTASDFDYIQSTVAEGGVSGEYVGRVKANNLYYTGNLTVSVAVV